MSGLADQVTAVLVHFRTPDLLQDAVRSFHAAYPALPIHVIDNGADEASRAHLAALCDELGPVLAVTHLADNIYHGPAMDQALRTLTTPYVFFLDTDTRTQHGGFLEPMVASLEADAHHYGAGQVVMVNTRGFADKQGTIPVLVSAYMLIKRSLYLDLPPFIHHGLPVLKNFAAAAKRGYLHQPFPVGDYVEHFGRGTAERYGYGLGLRSRLDFLLNRLGL